ncbi:MAG TPA: hypothetical protein DEV93_21895 [Chloroflexi bacterium]|nr:hypothetical protein [Chloroflexota bacterium]
MRSFIATALYVLLTAASVACRPGDDTGRTGVKELHATGVPVDTPPSSLVADSGFLKDPLNVSAWGDFVAVSDAVTDSLLIVFEPGTHRFLGALGSRTVSDYSMYPMMLEPPLDSTDGFKVFDPITRTMMIIGVGRTATLRRVTQLPAASSILQPLHLRDGRFISTALKIQGRFGVFAPDGKLIATRGQMPPGPSSVPIFVRQQANSARGTFNAQFNRIAFASRYADKLEIYDTTGRLIAFGSRPLHFDPAYTVGIRSGAPALGMNAASRIGYVDVAADSDRLYALFAGRTIKGNGASAYDGTEVHVYGWDGKLQRIITLGREASAITISPDGHFLFALTRSPHPALFEYVLKSSAKKPPANKPPANKPPANKPPANKPPANKPVPRDAGHG